MQIQLDMQTWREIVDELFKDITKRIDEKIQHVNEVLQDPCLTIQGCQRLKGKKDAFEEVKEMLSSPKT